jgi:hypothetical protein
MAVTLRINILVCVISNGYFVPEEYNRFSTENTT